MSAVTTQNTEIKPSEEKFPERLVDSPVMAIDAQGCKVREDCTWLVTPNVVNYALILPEQYKYRPEVQSLSSGDLQGLNLTEHRKGFQPDQAALALVVSFEKGSDGQTAISNVTVAPVKVDEFYNTNKSESELSDSAKESVAKIKEVLGLKKKASLATIVPTLTLKFYGAALTEASSSLKVLAALDPNLKRNPLLLDLLVRSLGKMDLSRAKLSAAVSEYRSVLEGSKRVKEEYNALKHLRAPNGNSYLIETARYFIDKNKTAYKKDKKIENQIASALKKDPIITRHIFSVLFDSKGILLDNSLKTIETSDGKKAYSAHYFMKVGKGNRAKVIHGQAHQSEDPAEAIIGALTNFGQQFIRRDFDSNMRGSRPKDPSKLVA